MIPSPLFGKLPQSVKFELGLEGPVPEDFLVDLDTLVSVDEHVHPVTGLDHYRSSHPGGASEYVVESWKVSKS